MFYLAVRYVFYWPLFNRENSNYPYYYVDHLLIQGWIKQVTFRKFASNLCQELKQYISLRCNSLWLFCCCWFESEEKRTRCWRQLLLDVVELLLLEGRCKWVVEKTTVCWGVVAPGLYSQDSGLRGNWRIWQHWVRLRSCVWFPQSLLSFLPLNSLIYFCLKNIIVSYISTLLKYVTYYIY